MLFPFVAPALAAAIETELGFERGHLVQQQRTQRRWMNDYIRAESHQPLPGLRWNITLGGRQFELFPQRHWQQRQAAFANGVGKVLDNLVQSNQGPVSLALPRQQQ